MKKTGILTGGVDAPGMNACIRAAVRAALANHLEIFGIKSDESFGGDLPGQERKIILFQRFFHCPLSNIRGRNIVFFDYNLK